MTAVMRAAKAPGPKLLRVGMVREGRVVEERVLREPTHVTVGVSAGAMFVLGEEARPGLPAEDFRLFEIRNGSYRLNFYDGMKGRIALPEGAFDLDALKGRARRTSGGAYQVRLPEDARGKVVVGERTFLFEFVVPTPAPPKPLLPPDVLRPHFGLDWSTIVIAAFSFLAHFLLLASFYSELADPAVDEDLVMAGLIDSMQRLPPPPPVEDKPEADADEKPKAEAKEPAPEAKVRLRAKLDAARTPEERRVAALANELAELEMATLAALSSPGPATLGVLEDGDALPTGLLDQAAESGAGVSSGGPALAFGSGGKLRPGELGTLADLGTKGRSTETGNTGSVGRTKAPKGSAQIGGESVSGGQVSNANRVVAGMRAGFHACYQRGLSTNPDAAGGIRLVLRIGPAGEVQAVTSTTTGNLPQSVVACVVARARAAQFEPPEGGAAVVHVPVSFVRQD